MEDLSEYGEREVREKGLLINLIADMRNRQVEMEAIIKLVGRYKYSEPQGFLLLIKECGKIGEILREYEGKLR